MVKLFLKSFVPKALHAKRRESTSNRPGIFLQIDPISIYLLQVNNEKIRPIFDSCSKLTIKTAE